MTRDEAIRFAVRSLSSGRWESQVHIDLVDQGFTPKEAAKVLLSAQDEVRGRMDREKNRRKLNCRLIGFSLIVIGIGTAIYGYLSTKDAGIYLVPAGLVGYGVYMMATGDCRPPI